MEYQIFGLLLGIVSFSIFLGSVLMMFRNNWVYRQRTKLNRFENHVHIINNYLSYNDMMVRFWIWDIEKLRSGDVK